MKIEHGGRRSISDISPVWRTQKRCLNTADTPTQTQCDLLINGKNDMDNRAADDTMSNNDDSSEM